MCGRLVIELTADELLEAMEGDHNGIAAWEPSWNIPPTTRIPIVVDTVKNDEEPVRRLELARWSLVPSGARELTLPFSTFNARSEDVASKPAFAESVVSRRAIIPVSGYYEWRREGEATVPHYLSADDEAGGRLPLAFAGLYSWWADPSKAQKDPSRWVLSAAILTMSAPPRLSGIHDRAPVVLPAEWWDDWLDPTIEGDQHFVDAAVEAAVPVADQLRFRAVRPLAGDGEHLIEPLVD